MDKCILCGEVHLNRNLKIRDASFITIEGDIEATVNLCKTCDKEYPEDLIFDMTKESEDD